MLKQLKKMIACATFAGTLLGPAVSIQDKPQAARVETLEQKASSFPSIHLKDNTAKATDLYNFKKAEYRLAVLGFDVMFNGLKAGIGAKCEGEDFWPAFGKGAIAGLFVYGGKEIASHNSLPFMGATGKLVHDFGVSVSDNVMQARPIFSRFRTDLGPVELEFDNSWKPSLYALPMSAIGLIANIAQGNRLDLKQSLYDLTPVFSFRLSNEMLADPAYYAGFTRHNVYSYCKNCYDRSAASIQSHEMNHVLFNSEFRFLDDYTGKKSELIEDLPILSKFAPAFDHVKLSQIMINILNMPMAFSKEAYWFLPPEMEAYIMENEK